MNRTLRGYGLVLLGATLWASMGLFYKHLIGHYGLTPMTIVFFRTLLTMLVLFAAHAVAWAARGHKGRIFPTITSRRDLTRLALFGLFGVALFYNVYATAVDLTGVGMAAVLMYTAPAWVNVFAALFMGEALTRYKAAAVGLAFVGAALVARVYEPEVLRLNPLGILFGLGAGLTYGMYTMLSKINLRRHSSWTVVSFSLFFGLLFMLPVQDFGALAEATDSPETMLWLSALALGPTLMGGVSFHAGLSQVPASNAIIVATLEPVIATLLGWLILGEVLGWPQIIGGALVLGAVLLLRRTPGGKIQTSERILEIDR